MHTWPELAKELITHRGTAAERSASGSMIVPELFPSSIVTFFRPAFRMICSPTGGDPVKEIFEIRGSTVSHSPTVPPDPTTTLKTPAGTPASSRISASMIAVSGVVDAGFRTSVFPTASAGPTLCATRFRGKLNGVIAETTPSGTRSQYPTRPSPAKLASIGTVSPWIRFASSAENRYVSTDRDTSPTEYFHAFPASRQMIAATSSWRFSRSWHALLRIWYRLWAGVRDQAGNALVGGRDRAVDRRLVGERDLPDRLAGELVDHRHRLLAAFPLPVDVQPVGLRHGSHGVSFLLGFRVAGQYALR